MIVEDIPDLGELERAVMQLIWAHAPLTAEEVRERLERGLKESSIRTDRLSYAEILMEVARDARPLVGAVAMARGPQISGRIVRMVSGASFSMSLSHRQRAMIGGTGTLVVLGALMATVATSGVAHPVSVPKNRFAPLLATLAKIDNGPTQLADSVGALMQRVSPTAAAAPAAPQPTDLTSTSSHAGDPGTYVRGGKQWGDQRLVNSGPAENVVTLGELKALPPEQAGDRMLGALAHGPVAKISFYDKYGPVKLLEKWTRVPEGCQRLEWTGQFLIGLNAPAESAWLNQAYAFQQIAMAGPDGCTSARYAMLGSGFDGDRDNAFKALAMFEETAAGKRAVTFDCKSPAGRNICQSSEAIRTELLRPVHRLLHMIGSRMALTYNSREFAGPLMYMTVTFDPGNPDQMTVEDLPFPAENRKGPPPPPPPVFDTRARSGPPPAPSPAMEAVMSSRGNSEAAVQLLIPLAEKGDAMAMLQLASIYAQGRGGVAQDRAKVIAYYRQAAETGDATPYGGGSTISGTAMYQLAYIYEHGLGVPVDEAEAANWWRRWAKTGDVRAGLVLAQRNIQP